MVSVLAVSLLALALLVGGAAALVEVENLPNFQHRISGTMFIQDEQTLVIQDFAYDGGGPDVLWYYYPPGVTANRRGGGITIPFSPTQDSLTFRRRYNGDEDVTITLPQGQTVCDIGTFTIWCRRFQVFFSSVDFPTTLFEPRNSPSDPCIVKGLSQPTVLPTPPPENCEPLDVNLHLSWVVDRTNEVVHYKLCGCTSAEEGTNQYMGFGLSGSSFGTLMFGADATITWVDDEEGANAQDYHLSNYVQCRAGVGACPDELDSSGGCTNDVFDVSGSKTDGVQCVSYSKGFSTSDSTCDIPLDPDNEQQYVVWGVGPLGETAFKHFNRATASDPPLFLGRTPVDNCVLPVECQNCEPFEAQQIVALEDATFSARIGPAGVDRGYVALTGQAGWGITWYINGSLIPELVVQRGSTYTFVVEGGDDRSNLARFHPFYLTDSQNGGILLNSVNTSAAPETIYAGFDADNNALGIGRFCEYAETELAVAALVGCGSVEDYQSYLELECQPGAPAIFTWTPNHNTPDVVYYQCANHLNLGWQITVMDDPDPCASRGECPVGSQCEVFQATNEAFCQPSCNLDNGGCASTEVCSLERVDCKRDPCPPVVQCTESCASRQCPVGSQCEVYIPTGETFCNSSCELDNGGCAIGESCQLREVQCVRAPCPPEVDCLPATPDCPPVCSYEFCKANKRAVCTRRNPQSNCTGECPLTFCRACYNLEEPTASQPGDCAACEDYDPKGRCFRRWVTCIRRAHSRENGKIRNRDRSESNFFCYDPCPGTTTK